MPKEFGSQPLVEEFIRESISILVDNFHQYPYLTIGRVYFETRLLLIGHVD
ncbi:hypothetical protein C518_1474 [Lysinibacillus fusiformis ZB2]|nr:hypothetical protein C518_1474 [Lysinibacillus fusiformis ZB2]